MLIAVAVGLTACSVIQSPHSGITPNKAEQNHATVTANTTLVQQRPADFLYDIHGMPSYQTNTIAAHSGLYTPLQHEWNEARSYHSSAALSLAFEAAAEAYVLAGVGADSASLQYYLYQNSLKNGLQDGLLQPIQILNNHIYGASVYSENHILIQSLLAQSIRHIEATSLLSFTKHHESGHKRLTDVMSGVWPIDLKVEAVKYVNGGLVIDPTVFLLSRYHLPYGTSPALGVGVNDWSQLIYYNGMLFTLATLRPMTAVEEGSIALAHMHYTNFVEAEERMLAEHFLTAEGNVLEDNQKSASDALAHRRATLSAGYSGSALSKIGRKYLACVNKCTRAHLERATRITKKRASDNAYAIARIIDTLSRNTPIRHILGEAERNIKFQSDLHASSILMGQCDKNCTQQSEILLESIRAQAYRRQAEAAYHASSAILERAIEKRESLKIEISTLSAQIPLLEKKVVEQRDNWAKVDYGADQSNENIERREQEIRKSQLNVEATEEKRNAKRAALAKEEKEIEKRRAEKAEAAEEAARARREEQVKREAEEEARKAEEERAEEARKAEEERKKKDEEPITIATIDTEFCVTGEICPIDCIVIRDIKHLADCTKRRNLLEYQMQLFKNNFNYCSKAKIPEGHVCIMSGNSPRIVKIFEVFPPNLRIGGCAYVKVTPPDICVDLPNGGYEIVSSQIMVHKPDTVGACAYVKVTAGSFCRPVSTGGFEIIGIRVR